jgi:GxxExxY protein
MFINAKGVCMVGNSLDEAVIGCAIEVHRHLGPGLLESSYEHCLMYELAQKGIGARSQVLLPINYKGVVIDAGYRLDIIIADQLILELKAVDKLSPIYTAQMLTYLKLTGIKTGFLINFNEKKLTDGLKRISL